MTFMALLDFAAFIAVMTFRALLDFAAFIASITFMALAAGFAFISAQRLPGKKGQASELACPCKAKDRHLDCYANLDESWMNISQI